jgi:hypothetical protein
MGVRATGLYRRELAMAVIVIVIVIVIGVIMR